MKPEEKKPDLSIDTIDREFGKIIAGAYKGLQFHIAERYYDWPPAMGKYWYELHTEDAQRLENEYNAYLSQTNSDRDVPGDYQNFKAALEELEANLKQTVGQIADIERNYLISHIRNDTIFEAFKEAIFILLYTVEGKPYERIAEKWENWLPVDPVWKKERIALYEKRDTITLTGVNLINKYYPVIRRYAEMNYGEGSIDWGIRDKQPLSPIEKINLVEAARKREGVRNYDEAIVLAQKESDQYLFRNYHSFREVRRRWRELL